MALTRSERYSHDSLALGSQDSTGNLFVSEHGLRDLSGVKVLHQGIDTVRQLYTGKIDPEFLARLIEIYDDGVGAVGEFFDHEFSVSSSGSRSGYRYRLQNNDLGIIVLIGSYYSELDKEGSHLKVEVSPHFIAENGYDHTNQYLATIARAVTGWIYKPSGVAVHMCVDVQGWETPGDIVRRLTSRSRSVVSVDGMDELQFDGDGIAMSFNQGETVTFGSPRGIQLSIYRKDLEAKKRDKIAFWKDIWGDQYSDGVPVYRIEVRMHQNVLKEFGNHQQVLDGTNYIRKFTSFTELQTELTPLWQSCLHSYRLDIKAKSQHLDPFWQLLLEDIQFYGVDYKGDLYRRVRKHSSEGAERNIAAYIGHSITLYARMGFNAKRAYQYLQNSGLWPSIESYKQDQGFSKSDMYQWFEKELAKRRLIGRAA